MRASFVFSMAVVVATLGIVPASAQQHDRKAQIDELECQLVDCEDPAVKPEAPTTGSEGRRHVPQLKGVDWAEESGGGSTPATVSKPAPIRPRRHPAPTGVAVLRVAFELGSARLTPDGVSGADDFLEVLNRPRAQGKRFLIAGHTDSSGPRSLNIQLSRMRARAVADYLIAHGVDASRLDVRGYGPDAPLPGKARSDPANRRVEVRVR